MKRNGEILRYEFEGITLRWSDLVVSIASHEASPKMKRRNPSVHSHRTKSWHGTEKRIEQYYGKAALLETWEREPDHVQIANHDYLLKLRNTVRKVRMYVLHRADPNANI